MSHETIEISSTVNLPLLDHIYDIESECDILSKSLTVAPKPGGTWCYAITLKGAKKFLKMLNNRVSDHIDQLLIKAAHTNLNVIIEKIQQIQ